MGKTAKSLKRKVKARETVLGTFVFEFFEAGVPMMIKQAGGEFAVFDMEHSGVSLERLKPLFLLSKANGVTPIVRIPQLQYHFIAGALDAGAEGIIVPMVETAEQMKTIIQYGKYYPIGMRGNAFQIAHDDYAPGSVPTKMAEANEKVFLIPLIESKLGAANAAEIIAFEEVDFPWVGHLDLSHSLGIPGDFEHPLFKEAIANISKACAKHRKGFGIVTDDKAMKGWYDAGARVFSYSADLWIFQNNLKTGIEEMRSAVSRI